MPSQFSLPSSMISSRAYSLTLFGLFCCFLLVSSWPGLFSTPTSFNCYKKVPFQVPTKVQFPLLPLALSPLQTTVTLPLELSQFSSGMDWTVYATCSSKLHGFITCKMVLFSHLNIQEMI